MTLWRPLIVMLSLACSTSIETFPQHNRCVYDSQKRLIGVGSVIAKRLDGAYLFQFNDSTQGDHGFLYIEEGGTRSLAPCTSQSVIDAEQFEREPVRP